MGNKTASAEQCLNTLTAFTTQDADILRWEGNRHCRLRKKQLKMSYVLATNRRQVHTDAWVRFF